MANRRKTTPLVWLVAILVAGGVCLSVLGQAKLQGSGNKYARYYPAPHQSQMQALIEGARTQPETNNQVLVTDARMQTFTTAGVRELEVRAPACRYSHSAGTLSDSGPIAAAFADGDFTLEGEGFLLYVTNLTLTVSNKVHSHLRASLLGKAGGRPAAPENTAEAPSATGLKDLEVYSDRFTYATNTGLGIYSGHVRVAGTNLALASQVLEVLVPVHESRVERIAANGEASFEAAGLRTAGDHVVYTLQNDEVRVTGHPVWRAQEREGSADELVLERTNGVLHANGNAELFAVANNPGAYGFSVPAATAGSKAVVHAVEIHAETYLLRTNLAQFSGQVRAAECAGQQVEGTLRCDQLTLSGSGSNTTAVAERHVDIRQTDATSGEERRFTCGKAVREGASGRLELSDNPTWSAGDSSGTGDAITATMDPRAMRVAGHAFLRLPADQIASMPSLAPTAAARVSAAKSFAEVHSESYQLGDGGAAFQGPVQVHHPDMIWKSGKLSVEAPKDTGSRRLLGEDGVVVDLLDAKGATHHGTAQTADLISGARLQPAWADGIAAPFLRTGVTNKVLVLSGDPALLTDETGNVRNKIIALDGVTHRVTTPGRYFMWARGPAVTTTNKFELPRGKAARK